MNVMFILASAVAMIAAVMVVTRTNIIHALLYFIVSLMAVALIFYLLGAPFVAALEIIIYAGAIMVLFVFAVMMLNPKVDQDRPSSEWARPAVWAGPTALTFILGAELLFAIYRYGSGPAGVTEVTASQVGMSLYGPYLLGAEMVSMILLAGLVTAYHLGRQPRMINREGGSD